MQESISLLCMELIGGCVIISAVLLLNLNYKTEEE